MEFINKEIQDYSDKHSSPEPIVLQELNRETHAKVMSPRMLSGHFQGRLLSLFSKMLQPKLVIEVGTYTGYSALCLAEGLREGGKLHTIDINPEQEKRIRTYIEKAGFTDKIELHIGNAKDIIPKIEGEIDLVFIDADKSNYYIYFELVADRMSKGGLVIADNVLWSGKILDEKERIKDKDTKALHEFNEKVSQDPRFEALLMPIRDGLMVLRRK
ncbi:MAG TPA: O-methyltransferase [Bacteroidia bacterium]